MSEAPCPPPREPTRPIIATPPKACDTHCHVFGPAAQFPYAPERKYTPCDASKEQLFALRDHLGFDRNVIVQATCHGADNRALVDALHASAGRARGVATVKRNVNDEELQALHAAGVRAVRFNFVKRLVDSTPKDELMGIAARVHQWGWHVAAQVPFWIGPILLYILLPALDLRFGPDGQNPS